MGVRAQDLRAGERGRGGDGLWVYGKVDVGFVEFVVWSLWGRAGLVELVVWSS